MLKLRNSTSGLVLWLVISVLSTKTAVASTSATPISDNVGTNNLIVNLGYAQYQGHVNPSTGNTEFLGVRFARAPVGELRWDAPQPPVPVRGQVLHADRLPERCIGTSSFGSGDFSPFVVSTKRNSEREVGRGMPREIRSVIDPPGMNEDCLFLNVYAPGTFNNQTVISRKLPVIIWIHGGGYSRGSASGTSNIDFFDGNDLIRESPLGMPAVVVVIQYRLGLFGFLAGREIGRRGELNVGLLDQQFALEWVHEHISKFGGDPESVVVWGQSAGAGSSVQHMVANGGNTQPRLFKSIISSSDFLPSQYRYDDPIPEEIYGRVVQKAGCDEVDDKLACLRSSPVEVLAQINNDITLAGFFGTFTFVPVVGGKFITKRMSELLQEGKFNGVEVVMANSNTFEGIHFVNPANPLPLPQYIKNLFPKLGNEEIQQAIKLYGTIRQDPGGNETMTMTNQAVAVHGEAILICPTYWLLRAFDGKAYKSEFAVPPGDHIIDVPYYWPSQGDGPAFKNPDFDTAFSSSFLNFAVFQDPKNNGTPVWNRWSMNGGMTEMLFNRTEDGQPLIKTIRTDEDVLERCRFWESVGRFTGQ